MIATLARRAISEAEETFHYYVDPAGDDTNPGSRALPKQTVEAAIAAIGATPGKGIGLKRGAAFRPAAALAVTANGTRFGAYGQGAKPILSGGSLVTGWGPALVAVPTSNLLTNGNLETWSGGLPTGWTVDQGVVTQQTATNVHGGTSAAKMAAGPVKMHQDVSLTANADYALNLWALSDTAGKQLAYQVTITTGANAGKYLKADGTWSASQQTIAGGAMTSFKNLTNTFTMLAETATVRLYLQYFDTGTYNLFVDDVQLGPTTQMAAKQAGLPLAPSTVTVTQAGSTTVLTQGSSAAALTANQWFWASNLLYVYLGATDPASVTVEASQRDVATVTARSVTFRRLELRHGLDRTVNFSLVDGWVIDRCLVRFTGYAGHSGSISCADGNVAGNYGGRVIGTTFDQLLNDGVWWHNTRNVEVGYCVMTGVGAVAGDVASDGIQIEETFNTAGRGCDSSGLWIHDNDITITPFSIKGCIIANATPGSVAGANCGGIIERNVCRGGNYGVSCSSGGLTVRNNRMLNQVSSFGGGLHIGAGQGDLAASAVYRNLIVGSNQNGLDLFSGSTVLHNWLIANNSFVDCAVAGVLISCPVSGLIANNLFVNGSGVPPLTLRLVTPPAGEQLIVDRNLFAAEVTGMFKNNATVYDTLAAWRAATGRDLNSVVGAPLLDGNYRPGVGSPARNAGLVIAGVTDGFLGAAPDIGYVEVT